MPLALHQPTPFETPSPSFKPGRKLSVVALAVLWQRLDQDPLCPSRVLLHHAAHMLAVYAPAQGCRKSTIGQQSAGGS